MLYAKIKVKSYCLVIIQFTMIVLFFIDGGVFCSNTILLSIQLIGIVLGIWAVHIMGSGNINIPPDLKENARLVVKGPYKIIRHPMYTAIIITILPLLVEDFSYFRLSVFVVLIADLFIKLNWEEKILTDRFPDYQAYQKKTYRIIPFIY